MNSYDFTLKFTVPLLSKEDLESSLYAAGCDDALVGVGASGRVSLDFSRDANTALDAITSAISNVKLAIPQAQLIEVTPDIVGLSDIAHTLGVSRQYARKLVLGTETYPRPFHAGSPLLWHLYDILYWLVQTKKYDAPATLIEVASINKSINANRAFKEIDPEVVHELDLRIAVH